MILEELPNKLAEFFGESVWVKIRQMLVSLMKCFPVSFLILFVNQRIERVLFCGFLQERHHSCNHYEENHSQCENVSRVPFIGLAFKNLWSHISLSSTLRVENTNYTSL
jgi:hypothetical protein